jgi:hypothetical protein|tara:strand:- start:554 stop:841 length:288 start_codon:yes stop_codon:yes gene_type:complete
MKKEGTLNKLWQEVQDALDETEPHDYYERLVRIEGLVKKLMLVSEDTMILSKTAYNKGFADAMSGHGYSCPYSTKDERAADYAFGFQMGIKEYES